MSEYKHIPMLPELLLQDMRTRNGGQWSISRTRALMKIRMRDERIRAEALKEAADRHCEVCHKTFPKKDGCEATCNRRAAILGETAKVKT